MTPFPTRVEPDAHLRLPYKGGARRKVPPPAKRTRAPRGFPGHIGNMSPKAWGLARKAAL